LNLAIDIGNTRTKIGLFEGEALIHKETLERLTPEALKPLLYNHSVVNCILSSVGGNAPEAVEMLKTQTAFVELSSDTPLPIENRYATPKTLGKDRLAAAVGAWALFPGKQCLIIDAGTCITCDVLSDKGVFLGGNISPGIDMRLKAMHTFTARLPLAERAPLGSWIGVSTETALQNGAQWGALWELSALIDYCETELGPLVVVATGGDADFFEKNLKRKIFANPDLVLMGLNVILIHHAVSHAK
jgi:type III pantothenate kinase